MSCRPDTLAAFAAIVDWIFDLGPLGYTEDQIRQISYKALVIHGNNDKVIPSVSGWQVSSLLPNAWFHVIPQCGHWAMIEQAGEFNMITNWFLTKA